MRSSYSDPTANTAIANVDRERRREEKRKKMLDNQEKNAISKSWKRIFIGLFKQKNNEKTQCQYDYFLHLFMCEVIISVCWVVLGMRTTMISAEKQKLDQALFVRDKLPIVDHLHDFFHGSPSNLLNFLILQMQ